MSNWEDEEISLEEKRELLETENLSWEEREDLEWELAHIRDGDDYCKTCQAYGMNCVGKSGYSPKQLRATESALDKLISAQAELRRVKVDSRAMNAAVKAAKLEFQRMVNVNRCTCDKEYGEADPDCVACLDQYRNERYGPDIHNVNCVCNECRGFGGWDGN